MDQLPSDLIDMFDLIELPVADAAGSTLGSVRLVLCHTCRLVTTFEAAEAHQTWCQEVSGGASDAEALLAG